MSNLITFKFLTHTHHTYFYHHHHHIYSLFVCQKYFHISLYKLCNIGSEIVNIFFVIVRRGKKDFKIDYEVNQAKLKFNCSQTILLFTVCIYECSYPLYCCIDLLSFLLSTRQFWHSQVDDFLSCLAFCLCMYEQILNNAIRVIKSKDRNIF